MALLLSGNWLFHWMQGTPVVDVDRLPTASAQYRVDINDSTWVEWMQLEGIGEVRARQIVENREQLGPFRNLQDVQRVSGIGPTIFGRIANQLECEDCATETLSEGVDSSQ